MPGSGAWGGGAWGAGAWGGGGSATHLLSGSEPNPTGTLTRTWHAHAAALTGAQPAASGTVARVWHTSRILSGAEPNSTGVILRVMHVFRGGIVGSQPSPTGILTRSITNYHKILAGVQSYSTGVLTRGLLQAYRTLSGAAFPSSGFITDTVATARILTGSQPAATAFLVSPIKSIVAGNQPYPIGGLSDVTVLRATNWGSHMQMWLPEIWYSRATRALSILASEGESFNQAALDIDEVRNARFPQTAPDWGVARLESEAGLTPRPELSLFDRRARALAHFRGIGSTLYRLKTISQAWDYGHVAIVADPESYTLYITFIDQRGVPVAIEDHQAEMRTNVLAHLGITWNYTYLVWGEPKRLDILWGQLKTAGRTWGQLKTMKPEALP